MAPRKRKTGRGGASAAAPVSAATRPSATAGLADQAATPTTTTPATATAAGSVSATPPTPPTPPTAAAEPAASAPTGRGARGDRPRPQPTSQNDWLVRYAERAEARNAEARAKLIPLDPGERPWPIQVSVALCAAAGLANLVLFIAGAKVGHKSPGPVELIVFVAIMAACAGGMWVLWYQAVLGFMVLLGIVIIYFALFLVEASNVLGVVYPVVIICGGGFLFWKLVRVLARLQMPERRERARAGRRA